MDKETLETSTGTRVSLESAEDLRQLERQLSLEGQLLKTLRRNIVAAILADAEAGSTSYVQAYTGGRGGE